MDDDARRRFSFHLEAMNNAMSQFEVNEARRAADAIAREHGMSFERARQELRSPIIGDVPGREDEESDEEDDDEGSPPPAPDAGQSAMAATAQLRSSSAAGASSDVSEADEPVQSRSSDVAAATAAIETDASHLSTEERGREAAINAALAANPTRSDRDVAREVRCSPTTVGRARAAAGLARLVRSVRRGGESYEMATGRLATPRRSP